MHSIWQTLLTPVNELNCFFSLQLYIWQLKDNDLMGVAFIDTQIYIHTLVTIKHIILAGDILKSVQVYQYQEEHKVLSIVSRVSMGENQNQLLGGRNLIFTFLLRILLPYLSKLRKNWSFRCIDLMVIHLWVFIYLLFYSKEIYFAGSQTIRGVYGRLLDWQHTVVLLRLEQVHVYFGGK